MAEVVPAEVLDARALKGLAPGVAAGLLHGAPLLFTAGAIAEDAGVVAADPAPQDEHGVGIEGHADGLLGFGLGRGGSRRRGG